MMKLTKEFLFAGKAIFTVELSQEMARVHGRPHFTFMVKKMKGYGVRYGVLLLRRGAEYPQYNSWIGTLNHQTGEFAPAHYAEAGAVSHFRLALAVILAGGGVAFERYHETGCNIHPSSHCCRCGRALTVPASVETGIGPECELFVRLGVQKLDEVPCMTDRQVARLQYDYWMNSDKVTLAALKDACLEAWDDVRKAELLVEATKKTMRKFKKGSKLPWRFVSFARGN